MTFAHTITKKHTVGILGGMGPASTAHFYQELIRLAQERYGAERDHEFPAMIMYSLPLLDTTGITDMNQAKRQLVHAVKTLEHSGADFIVIPCNTVHHLYETMQNAVKIPIVNMIDQTVKRIKERGFEHAGIMGTETTLRLGIYHRSGYRQNVKMINVTKKEQELVTAVIANAEAGRVTSADTHRLREVIAGLMDRGAECAILGCTELPIALRQSDISVPIFDTSMILAETAVFHAYGSLPITQIDSNAIRSLRSRLPHLSLPKISQAQPASQLNTTHGNAVGSANA